ncbi:MAG: glycoside hydrolase family 5 protein, partial [Phycisphaeraceae bacterium]
LLDYHAAPQGQNATPPADNPTGYADLWKSAHAQDRVVELWKALARRYAKHPANLGYNLLNEPQTNLPNELSEDRQVAAMNALNHRLIREIRAIDPDGWIVIEGPVRQCGGNDKLDDALFEDPRTAATFHHYPLFENSLNLPGPRLPENDDVAEHTAYIVEQTRAEQAMMERTQRPMLLGEYGLSARWNPEQALAIFQAQTDAAEQCGFGWMIWTWKDIWRLGLVTPREDTPWFQFTRGEKILARVQALGGKLGSFFDGVADDLPETAADRELRGMAMDDMRRGLNRLILDAQIRELAARPTAEILAMPEAFKLENCRLREHYYDAVKPYLAR